MDNRKRALNIIRLLMLAHDDKKSDRALLKELGEICSQITTQEFEMISKALREKK